MPDARHTRDVAAGVREAGDEPSLLWFEGGCDHDDGGGLRRLRGRLGCGTALRHDHINFESQQRRDSVGEVRIASEGRAVLDQYILTLDVAALTQSLAKRSKAWRGRAGAKPQQTDLRHLP